MLAEDGLLKQLTKAVIERCLETELDTHLGYAKHGRHGNASGNTRNGSSQKTVKGEQGQIEIEVPRDQQGTFEPQLVKKGQTRDEAVFKVIYLAMRNIAKKWTMPIRDWKPALNLWTPRGRLICSGSHP